MAPIGAGDDEFVEAVGDVVDVWVGGVTVWLWVVAVVGEGGVDEEVELDEDVENDVLGADEEVGNPVNVDRTAPVSPT